MIVRFWRGWTTAANADGYEELVRSTIFPDILDRGGNASARKARYGDYSVTSG
jgi:hypothetical protein